MTCRWTVHVPKTVSLNVRYFWKPLWTWPPNRNFKNFKFFQNSPKEHWTFISGKITFTFGEIMITPRMGHLTFHRFRAIFQEVPCSLARDPLLNDTPENCIASTKIETRPGPRRGGGLGGKVVGEGRGKRGKKVWEVLNGVGVDGVGEFSPFFWCLCFFCFSSFFFVFLLLS